jgi:hypothetical protein
MISRSIDRDPPAANAADQHTAVARATTRLLTPVAVITAMKEMNKTAETVNAPASAVSIH